MDARENGGDVVCRTPSILQDIQAELAGGIDVGVEHLADKLDLRRLVWVLLFELHNESEGAIFKRSVCRAYDDGVPERVPQIVSLHVLVLQTGVGNHQTHHVITLSGTGEADTPAGGSVCMRWGFISTGSRWTRAHDGPTLKSRIKRRRAAVDMARVLGGRERELRKGRIGDAPKLESWLGRKTKRNEVSLS